MDPGLASAVQTLLDEIGERVRQSQAALGLACPPGCGECCLSTEVEASVLEMLPVAERLVASGAIESWLERLAALESPSRCVFYSPDELCYGGRCRVYPFRPSVCRLFGFAAVRSKTGQPVFSACRALRRLEPERCAAAERAVAAGLEVVCFADEATRIAGIDPGLGWKKLPVNRALREALERVALARGLRDLEAGR